MSNIAKFVGGLIWLLVAVSLSSAAEFDFDSYGFCDLVKKQAEKRDLGFGQIKIDGCRVINHEKQPRGYCDTTMYGSRARLWFNREDGKISVISLYPAQHIGVTAMPIAIALLIMSLEPSIPEYKTHIMAQRLISADRARGGRVVETGQVARYSGENLRGEYVFEATPIGEVPPR